MSLNKPAPFMHRFGMSTAVMLNPSGPVILSKAKDLILLRVDFRVKHDLTRREVDIVLAGGMLNYTKKAAA